MQWRVSWVALLLAVALTSPVQSGEVRQLGMAKSRPGPAPLLQPDANAIKLRAGRITAGAMTLQATAQAGKVAQEATSALGATPRYLYYLVHLPRRAGFWDAQKLAAAGFPVLHTVPENTLLVRCPVSLVRRMTAVAGADFVTPLTAVHKTAPGFRAPSALPRRAANGEELLDLAGVSVRLFPGEASEPVADRFRQLGLTVRHVVPDYGQGAVLDCLTGGTAFPMIAAHPAVSWVQEAPRPHTTNDLLTGATAIAGDASRGLINAYDAWNHTTKPVTGTGQTVGHIDSGVDRGGDGGAFHVDLDGKVSGAGLANRYFSIFYNQPIYTVTIPRTKKRIDDQAFTCNWTGTVTTAEVILGRSGTGTTHFSGSVFLRIRAGGSIPGSVLGSSEGVDVSFMEENAAYYVTFPFNSGLSLTRNTSYFLEIDYSAVSNITATAPTNIFGYGVNGGDNTNYYHFSENGGKSWTGSGTYAWYRLIGDGSDAHWLDLNGHGTHTAGTICGAGVGNSARKGVAPAATLVHRAAGTGSGGGLAIPDLTGTLTDMHNAGARVYSNSWGGGTNGQYSSWAVDVDNFMWNNPGDLVCFSAGNNGADAVTPTGKIDANTIGPPGTAKNCLTVGNAETYRTSPVYTWAKPTTSPFLGSRSTEQTDTYGSAGIGQGLCPSSSRGPTLDGRLKPEVVAPGWLYSCRSAYDNVTDSMPTDGTWSTGRGYRAMNGTSMACPAVAGAAALVRDYLMRWKNISAPSAALLKAVLIAGADNLSPGQYGIAPAPQELYDNTAGTGSPDYAQGYGRINVAKSLGMLDTLERGFCGNNTTPFTDTTTARYLSLRAASAARISAVLVWTDYPGTTVAAKALVNDLDLQVRTGYTGAKGSGVLAAECLLPINEQTGIDPGQGDDDVNTVEKCVVGSVTVGTTYTFEVSAETLGHAGQTFALVVTGDFDQWLPVTVRQFEGRASRLGTRLRWELAEGPDFVGCHVYRAASPQGPFTKLTAQLLPPDRGGYEFTDARLKPGPSKAYYRIVGVRSNGETEAQDSPPYQVEVTRW